MYYKKILALISTKWNTMGRDRRLSARRMAAHRVSVSAIVKFASNTSMRALQLSELMRCTIRLVNGNFSIELSVACSITSRRTSFHEADLYL